MRKNIHWVFYCVLHLKSDSFLEIYEQNDKTFISSLDISYFRRIMNVFDKFCKYEPYLDSIQFLKYPIYNDFEKFLQLSHKKSINFNLHS